MSQPVEREPGAQDETELSELECEPSLVDSSERLLEELLATQAETVRWRRQTEAGYTVELSRGKPESLRLFAPAGTLCATIHLDPGGPRLEIEAAELHARAGERVRLEGDTVEIVARETLALHSEGTIHAHAGGLHRSDAFEHHIEACRGEVRLVANDDVALDGEHIRLNSPPIPTPKHLRREADEAERTDSQTES